MKNIFTSSFILLGLLLMAGKSHGQNNFFTDVKESALKTQGQQRVIVPQKYRTLSLDTISIANFLATVPSEKNIKGQNNTPVLSIPMPNGKTALFHVWESPMMEPALAAKFPSIKTFTGQGITDGAATLKMDWTGDGFHAMILSAVSGAAFIDPYARGNKVNYISYFKSDFKKDEPFIEDMAALHLPAARPVAPANVLAGQCIAGKLRTYRLAIACTHQYAIAATGLPAPTVQQTLDKIIVTLNRVNGIYETELDIHFNLIANEDQIIFPSATGDPFTGNNSAPLLLSQSQTEIGNRIGNANYDVGQTFSTGAGGVSYIGIVCQPNQKASSVTGLSQPYGDPFDVDYVSHEIGHEFGAYHSFNSQVGFCSQAAFMTSNSEPGSGSTIMCYAGLCNSDNLQVHSDPYFNAIGYNEIVGYSFFSSGASCAVNTNSGNNPPVVAPVANYTIPTSTPFILTGSATDAEDNNLTYCWEQTDIGGPYGSPGSPSGDAPLFRSFTPVATPTRYFPKLSDVINNTTTIGELLPTYARTMHFRMTVRDNHAGCGGICSAENAVTVDAASGPFIVTYPDAAGITFKFGDTPTVTWNPAGTTAAPVSCSNVTVQLSTDGGLTFPITLLASTPNTGSAQVQMPGVVTTTARIRVMAVGNVFYDMSNNNFTIRDSAVPLTWVSFTATKQSNNTGLFTWVVNEQNTNHYEIERSYDDVVFTPISQVASLTGNALNQQYSFTDKSPYSGINYYRIKEVYADGSYAYSSIASLSFDAIPTPWTVFPNPSSTGGIFVLSNGSARNVMLQLYDAAGKLMYEKSIPETTIGGVVNLNFTRFSKAVYTLKISSTQGVTLQKIRLL